MLIPPPPPPPQNIDLSDARLATQARDASDSYNSYSPIPPRDVSVYLTLLIAVF